MTNFEKVKEMMRLEDSYNGDNPFCDAVGRLKKEECCTMFCEDCYEWLKQEYKPQILTDKEREYLSAVIKPFRSEIRYIIKNKGTLGEFIVISTGYGIAELPRFEKSKYYKGMETEKRYSLEELGL